MIKLVEKEHCSGCTACMACCPKEAISMCADEEGFKYPVIDRNQCVECEKCVRTCPVTNKQKKNPVVHYMTPEYTKKCVESIQCRLDTKKYKIIIVDNASPDKSGQMLGVVSLIEWIILLLYTWEY